MPCAISGEVRDDEQVGLGERELADRALKAGFAAREADIGLEPLSIGGDEADESDGCRTEARSEARNVIEALLGRGAEHRQGIESREPVRIGDGMAKGVDLRHGSSHARRALPPVCISFVAATFRFASRFRLAVGPDAYMYQVASRS